MLTTDGTAREAARLRYELARLRDRRTVRAALAVTTLRRDGAAAALAALRGAPPRWDVPGPATVPLRSDYPHLWVVHTGSGALLAGAVARERLTARDASLVVARDRPDLLLVDGVDGFSAAELTALIAEVRRHGGAVVTHGRAGRDAVPDADLHLAAAPDTAADPHGGDRRSRPPGADDGALIVPAAVDIRRWSPVGLEDTAPAHTAALVGLAPAAARRQPVVAVTDVAAVGIERCLAAMAAGAVVVAVDTPAWTHALAGLDAATRALITAPRADQLDERLAPLLADDDGRRRVSVRLRRHVQRHHSTHAVLARIVTTLGIDAAPSRRVTALLATRRPDRLAQVCHDLAAQRDVDLELVVLPHGVDAPSATLPAVSRVLPVSADRPLGAVLNAGLDVATGGSIAKVDDDDRYGPDHLADLLLALQVSGAELVGRRVHGVFHEDASVTVHPPPGGEERFEDHLPGATMLLPADVLRAVRWRHVPRAVDTELVRAVHLAGGSAYTSHRYGFVRVRHDGTGSQGHTSPPRDVGIGRVRAGFDPTLLEA